MPKVSVIVPVYKVEKYIARCARSLFVQTIDDIEYIFIDDCSPDDSITVLKEVIQDYPNRISQVKIVRMPVNRGQAEVRKCGVKLATGDYIIHCDSDDWVDERMYEELYNTAILTNSDIVVCDFYKTDSTRKEYIKSCMNHERETFLFDCLCGKSSWSLCNKLVRRDLYATLEVYPSLNMGEDMLFAMQLIYNSKIIAYLNKAYYYYYSNDSSIVRSNIPEHIFGRFSQAVDNAILLEKILKKYLPSLKFSFAFDVMKFRQRNLLLPLIYDKYYYKVWMSTFPKLLFSIWMNPYVSLREKVKFYLYVLRLYK